MTTLMKATQPHWLGNKFVPIGSVLPEGHSEVIPAFYEAFEVEDPAPARDVLQDRARSLGIKRVGNKSDDRLAEEIADAEAGLTPDGPEEVDAPDPVEEVPTTDGPEIAEEDAPVEAE